MYSLKCQDEKFGLRPTPECPDSGLFVYKLWKEMEEEKVTTQPRRCQFAL